MSTHQDIDQLSERVERLLLRYQELQRSNELLQQELSASSCERDSLKSRLSAARMRIDVLLERIPSPTKTETNLEEPSDKAEKAVSKNLLSYHFGDRG